MDMSEVVPSELIPALTWMGKHDWLTYRMAPNQKHTIIDFPVVILPTPEVNHLRPTIARMLEPCAIDQLGLLNYFAISKALAKGPKLLKPTPDQCRALEHVDLNVAFNEYKQPYPGIFVEFPTEYRKELTRRFSLECPSHVLSYHDPRTGYLIVSSFSHNHSHDVINVLPPRSEYRTIEDGLRQPADVGTDIDLAEVVQRLALNFSLMLTHLGVRENGLANAGRMKKLARVARHKKRNKAARAEALLAVMPKLISFNQEINFFVQRRDADQNGDAGASSAEYLARKPHWRRGHFRHQRIGPARTQIKLIFIRPVLVNRLFFGGEEKDTQVVYASHKS